MQAFKGITWAILLSIPLWAAIVLLLVGCKSVRPMPVPQQFQVSFTLLVVPDHTYFPSGRRSKEVAGCASPGKVWIKGLLSSDGELMPESMAVLGHEVWHILDFAFPGIKNPDEETSGK